MRIDEKHTMETLRFTMSQAGARAVPAEKEPPLKIVGMYADEPSHTLALEVLRSLARNCSAICDLNSDWWSFGMLEAATEREAAGRVAADADMIWCAANAWEGLPEAAMLWADLWSARRNETECALVALLRCPASYLIQQSPSWAHLCRLARAAGLELFVQRFDCDCPASVEAQSQASFPNDWLPPESEPGRGQIRWGINE